MRLKTSSSLLLMLVLATLSSVVASATDHLVRHNLLRTPPASDNHTVGGSPLRSLININDVLNSITVEFIDSVVLRDVSAPDTFHCLEDEIAVGLYANSTTNNILYSMTVLNVTVSDAQDVLHNYIKHNEMNVLQGIVPSSVLDLNGFLLIDPIYPYNRVRWEDPNVIYFYPTLEQQFYVFSNYFASSSSASGATPQDIYAVINAETPKENVLVAAALERAMSNFGLSFDYQLTAASVVDFLKPDCVNIVVGITSADILPLQTFLRDNLRAIVVVTFDDLTIQYTEVRALGIKDFDVMERILFATNLPLWTHRATTYEVAMIVFFEHFRRPYHTPAAVRAYFSMLMLDQLTSHTRTTSSIRKAIYDNTEMAVDSTTMGDFTDVCPFPTQQPLSCLVNFGAQNIRIWTYGGVHRIDSVPLFGPTTPPVSFFTQSDDLRMLATEPRLAIVSVISGIIWAMVIFLIVLAYLCAMGYLDDVHAVVSILHVSVEHVNQGNGVSIFRIQEVLQRYADVVDSLVEKHHAMQVGSHPKNFVLAARKADDALALARDLIATVNQLQPQLPMGATVGLRIGIHTDSCSCAQALDENDLDRLAVAAAPLTMLAQCVGELCSANEILLTGWTYAQLGENPIRQTCKLHSRNTLDDETVVIEVYRYSPQVNEAMERLLREEFSLLSLTSVEESKRLASMATVRPPTTDETHIMESSHNVSNRLNALGMILMADESSDEMSSRLIHYDL